MSSRVSGDWNACVRNPHSGWTSAWLRSSTRAWNSSPASGREGVAASSESACREFERPRGASRLGEGPQPARRPGRPSPLNARPRRATPCGTPTALSVFSHTLTVITPYHHYPLLNTAVLDKATDLYGCPRLNMALDLTWRSGAPMVVHTFRPNDQRPGWGGIYEHS